MRPIGAIWMATNSTFFATAEGVAAPGHRPGGVGALGGLGGLGALGALGALDGQGGLGARRKPATPARFGP
jgi:hypothetical protein